MTLSLKQSQALAELADRLYPFLPGKPHPYADQSLSFPGVAAKLGLAQHWSAGSKGPAITRLLTETLESGTGRFCSLILAVVRHGITYRTNKEPVTREEIERLDAIKGSAPHSPWIRNNESQPRVQRSSCRDPTFHGAPRAPAR